MKGGFHSAPEYDASGAICTVPVRCEYCFDIAIIDSLALEHYDLLLFRERGWGNERFLGSVCSRSG
jgi:hypothetical protein